MSSTPHRITTLGCIVLMCSTSFVAAAPGGVSGAAGRAASKVARCAAGDHPEPALQGQIPAAIRATGFTESFSCNLTLVGQYAGGGSGIGFASIKDDHGHSCAYYPDGSGTNVVDVTDPAKPALMSTLKTPAMLNPWESLRVNARQQLLVAISSGTGAPPMPGPNAAASALKDNSGIIDVYDLSGDCRSPKLLASTLVGTGADGGAVAPKPVRGHEGNFSPDGLTFYAGDSFGKNYSAMDLKDPGKPKLIVQADVSQWPLNGELFNGTAHGLSISNDGNRGYFVSVGMPKLADITNPNAKVSEGFYVIDTSEVQARKPNAQLKIISLMTLKDGSGAQHTLNIKIGGRPYLVFVNEMGSGGVPGLGGGTWQDACNAGVTPFPMGRLIDIHDETKPELVANLALETHDPANCSKILPDLVGESGFTYGSHFCSVDNRENATALACGYWQSGIRVFDIRNPAAPKGDRLFQPGASDRDESVTARLGAHESELLRFTDRV